MKAPKRVLTTMLVATLIASSFAGCSQKAAETTKPKEEVKVDKQTETKDTEKSDEASKYLASDKEITLTIHEMYNKNPFDNDYPVFKKAAELTNVKLEGVISQSTTDNNQAYNLMIASGDMPDIVGEYMDFIIPTAIEGAYMPLDDLVDQYAPHIKAFLDAHPDYKKSAQGPDGKLYMIPYISDGDCAEGWFIRQDWLEKLGLETPKTIDEYHDALLAIVNNDPNGNGEKDEIGFFSRNGNTINKLADIALLWGAESEWYVENGKVKFGPYEEAYKEAYKNIAEWYAEGIIDPEIYTRGKKSRDIMLLDNIGASCHDWFGSTSGYNDKVKDKIEGFKFYPMAPPANIDGKIIERTVRSKTSGAGWAISHSNKNPEATMKYFDFFFTEEGRRLMNFGLEGVHYDMVDGKPIFKDEILNSDKGVLALLREDGIQLQIGMQQDFEYEKQWMNPVALQGVEEYMANGYPRDKFPKLTYTEKEQARYSELLTTIKTLRDETTQTWVLSGDGSKVEKEHASFRKELEDLGVEELIAIQQAAYDRYMGK